MDRTAVAAARKKLLRRGRALLRQRGDTASNDGLAGLSEGERQEIAEVHAALERIERGIYARCDKCFGDIEFDRLEQCLWERRCLPCAAPAETTAEAGAAVPIT